MFKCEHSQLMKTCGKSFVSGDLYSVYCLPKP